MSVVRRTFLVLVQNKIKIMYVQFGYTAYSTYTCKLIYSISKLQDLYLYIKKVKKMFSKFYLLLSFVYNIYYRGTLFVPVAHMYS